jgi:hypothetical protein
VSLADLARVTHQLAGAIHGPSIDLGYALAVAGLALLTLFAIAGAAMLVVRLARAAWNMSPGRFLTLLFAAAWVMLAIGVLLP